MPKTALLLSAGGMLGAYQAGAWKTLSQWLRPDMVVGASVGALNGWAIASGWSGNQLQEQWLDSESSRLMRFRFPLVPWRGVFDSATFREKVRELYDSGRPRMPFGLVITEMPRARAVLVCDEGVTLRHLHASCAIPGGFPQVRINGRFYSDGGLLNPLPLWAAVEMGAQRIVAIDALHVRSPLLVREVLASFRRIMPAPKTSLAGIEVLRIAPKRPLGTMLEAAVWSRDRIRAWIDLGERDASAVISRL
ncbi:MAG: patatin-like phospholipase family protein [Bryobacteraceae bacterium]